MATMNYIFLKETIPYTAGYDLVTQLEEKLMKRR
jgi:hypothetical protein